MKSPQEWSQEASLPLLDFDRFGYTVCVGCAGDAQAVPHFDSHPGRLAWHMNPWSPE
jgi:hypothetical protein